MDYSDHQFDIFGSTTSKESDIFSSADSVFDTYLEVSNSSNHTNYSDSSSINTKDSDGPIFSIVVPPGSPPSKIEQKQPDSKETESWPSKIDDVPSIEKFEAALSDDLIAFNPKNIGFIPKSFWADKDMTFGSVVTEFFQRKNNSNCRFIHKLYNAVKLTEYDKKFIPIVGIQWVNDSVLRINRAVFAKLLGIKAIEGSLFHQQGNFPSHGFVELEPADVRKMFPAFDFSVDRLIMHQDKVFVRGCNEEQVLTCKWKQDMHTTT